MQVERVKELWVHGCTAAPGTGVFLGEVGAGNDVLLEGNRLKHARRERAAVAPDNEWNICSHAFNGSRWIRDSGERNLWLPLPAPVAALVRKRWTQEQVDGIFSVSRVEANARKGAEVIPPTPIMPGYGAIPAALRDAAERGEERRRIYIIESRTMDERLVVFEDGELLRTVNDPEFHAY